MLKKEGRAQIVLESTAQKIKNIVADVRAVDFEIIPNKVILQGIIHKQIFYVGVDNLVHHQTEEVSFSTFIDIPGAESGMEAQVEVEIEHLRAVLAPDGESIHQKILLQIFVKVVDPVQMQLPPGEDGDPLFKLEEVVAEGLEQEMFEASLELEFAALKVTEIQAEIIDIETSVLPDKVLIQGVIHKQVFYVDQEGVGRHQAEDVPFSLFIDLPGVEPGMNLQVDIQIEHIKANLVAEGTILEQEIILEVFVKVSQTVQTTIAQGIGPMLKLPQVINETEEQLMQMEIVELEFPAIKVREIQASFLEIDATVIENKVLIQGIIDKQVFYIDEEDIERHQAEEISFSQMVELPGVAPGMDVQLTPIIEHIKFQLLPDNTVEQKIIIGLFLKVTETMQLQIQEGPGPLYKVPQVVGEDVKQLLIEVPVEIPPIPPLALITQDVKEIRVEEVVQQEIIEEVVPLEPPVIKLKRITAEIEQVAVEIINHQALISGIIHKQIELVGEDDIVRHQQEEIPFQFLKDLPEGFDPELSSIVPEITIEHLEGKLIDEGQALEQIIILLIELRIIESRIVTVVTEVEGPGITTVKQPVVANLLITRVTQELELLSELELIPPATEILEIEAEIMMLRVVEVEEGEIIIAGLINKEVEYAVNEETEVVTESLEFEETVELEAALQDRLVQIEAAEIIGIEFELSPDGQLLTQEILLEMELVVTEEAELEVVIDVTGVADFTTDLVQFIEPPEPKEVVTDVTF